MVSSEVFVLLGVYSGLLIYFLIPFKSQVHSQNGHGYQTSFLSVYHNHLVHMIFHKKAILALLLFVCVLYGIKAGYAAEEWHYNAHSGRPSVSNELAALYKMSGVMVYTVLLVLFINYWRTLSGKKK